MIYLSRECSNLGEKQKNPKGKSLIDLQCFSLSSQELSWFQSQKKPRKVQKGFQEMQIVTENMIGSLGKKYQLKKSKTDSLFAGFIIAWDQTHCFIVLNCNLNWSYNNQKSGIPIKEDLSTVACLSLAGDMKNQYFMTCHIFESSVMCYPQMLKLFDSSKAEGSKTERKFFAGVTFK